MISNLALAGGGINGITYLGVYNYLMQKNLIKDIKIYSGTSIGSIFCLFMNLNYTYNEVEKIIYNLNSKSMEDINIKYFFTNYGLDSGAKIEHFIKQIIASKGIKYDITFKELYDLTNKRLDVCTTRLNDCSKFIFNYINTPEEKVYKACKYSVNIPMIWCSVPTPDGIHYIDGCFSANLPIDHLPITNTLGIYCSSSSDNLDNIGDIKIFMKKIIQCSFKKGNKFEIKNYIQRGYDVLCINIPKINSLDLDLPVDVKKQFIHKGYEEIENKFKK